MASDVEFLLNIVRVMVEWVDVLYSMENRKKRQLQIICP